jgi:6-phosphofructokinase 1
LQIYFRPEEVKACIVTCGGLCPGINTVIREIVCSLWFQYGVRDIIGIVVCDYDLNPPTIYFSL